MQCYYIIGKNEKGEDVRCPKQQETAFCSEEHHEAWAKRVYGRQGERKVGHTIEFMQAGLLRMGNEVKQNKQKYL